jgi:hypothetical protein
MREDVDGYAYQANTVAIINHQLNCGSSSSTIVYTCTACSTAKTINPAKPKNRLDFNTQRKDKQTRRVFAFHYFPSLSSCTLVNIHSIHWLPLGFYTTPSRTIVSTRSTFVSLHRPENHPYNNKYFTSITIPATLFVPPHRPAALSSRPSYTLTTSWNMDNSGSRAVMVSSFSIPHYFQDISLSTSNPKSTSCLVVRFRVSSVGNVPLHCTFVTTCTYPRLKGQYLIYTIHMPHHDDLSSPPTIYTPLQDHC